MATGGGGEWRRKGIATGGGGEWRRRDYVVGVGATSSCLPTLGPSL